MSLWLAGSLFFGGALTHMVVSYYLSVYQSEKFVKDTTEHMLTFVALFSWGFANALHMKYEALSETNLPEEEKLKIIQIDKTMYEVWKRSIATRVFPSYPQKHIKLLPTFDWDGALRPLDNIYYNKEHKTQEAQSNEQD